MRFDRFDICEAWYLFASLYHTGQNSFLYSRLGQLSNMGFQPKRSLCSSRDLSENGQMIYQWLVSNRENY